MKNALRRQARHSGVFALTFVVVFAIVRVRAQDGFATVGALCTGGAGGPTVIVTNGTDFNTQINVAGARIIQVQGPITIGKVSTTANKTIVGLSTNAALLGNLNISGVSNVIVQNLRITNPGNDGLTIREAGANPGSHHVWVDHCTFIDCGDGSCDINNGAEFVTVSWCKFIYPTQQQHRFTMIADGLAGVGTTNYGEITLHHNWWSTRSDQRMPASSYGRIHMFNNYFTCTNNSYCSNARSGTEMLSENNFYAGVDDPIYADADKDGKIRTSGNTYAGCTGLLTPGTDTVFTPPYAYTLDATATVPSLISGGAGASGPDLVVFPPKIWDGGAANNNLNTALNWKLDETPKAYDVMTFAGATRLAPNNNYTALTEFYGLTFSNNAGAFVLGGNALSLGSGLVDDSPVAQTINCDLTFAFATDHFSTNRLINVSATGGSLVLNGGLAGGSNTFFRCYALTKQGPGLLTLAGFNSFDAELKLNGGFVRFSTLNPNLAGSLGSSNVITFAGGGLQWAPGNAADISTRSIRINSGGAILDPGANTVTFANAIGGNGPGSLTKIGSGELALNGANTYTGGTILSNGTLRVNGSLSTGAVRIEGGTLAGAGTIAGPVTVAAAGIVSPGNSIGSLTVNNSLTNTGTLLMELNKSGSVLTNDDIKGLVTIAYGGTLQLAATGDPLAAGDSFKLFGAVNCVGTFANMVPATPGEGLVWNTAGLSTGILSVAVISQPQFSGIRLSGGNLVLDGTNGVAHGLYYVLTSTNLTLPLANWTRVATNSFDGTGAFSFLLPASPEVIQGFFLLQLAL